MVGEGCAGPPKASMRIDHASASARSASRAASMARLRAPSARILAPMTGRPSLARGTEPVPELGGGSSTHYNGLSLCRNATSFRGPNATPGPVGTVYVQSVFGDD